ncbi:MAG: lysostaphin resistance A-like protein [Bacteroidota bacterium]
MKKIFINPETSKIRALWRILLFVGIFLILSLAIIGSFSLVIEMDDNGPLKFTLVSIAATIAAYISRTYIDKESLLSLGLKPDIQSFMDVLSGIIIGALAMTTTYFIMLATRLIEFNGFSWWAKDIGRVMPFSNDSLLTALIMFWQFIAIAWWEELLFRGILIQNIKEGLGLKWAVVISTLIFGVVHAGNPNATLLSTALIILITFLLVYAYIKTGQLWLPFGIHLGWNFFQSSIFGFASSGLTTPTMISQTPLGPDWLSGGEFGAEASVLIIPLILISLLLIRLWTNWSRRDSKPAFK